MFRGSRQESLEFTDQYCKRLRQKASKCIVHNELKTQITEGCTSKGGRRKALERCRSLDEILERVGLRMQMLCQNKRRKAGHKEWKESLLKEVL